MIEESKKKIDKKYLIIAILLLLIGVISFTTYSIYRNTFSGNGTITSSKWSVQLYKNSEASPVANLNFTNSDISWTTHNGENGKIAPGDSGTINYTIDASGSQVDVAYSATIGTITGPNGLTATISPSSGTIPYASGANAMRQQLVITVTWAGSDSDNPSKDSNDMNNNNSTISIPVTLTVKQDMGVAATGSYVVSSSDMYIGEAIPDGVNVRNTAAEAMADWEDIIKIPGDTRPFYLKYTIENNIITESYVEFVVTPEMATANPGMTTGTYSLRGGINESNLTDKPILLQNAKTIYDAFGGVGCTLDGNEGGNPYTTAPTSYFYCNVSGLYAEVDAWGYVYARGGNRECHVVSGGCPRCN